MKKNIITFLVATMMISVSVAPALAKQSNQNGKFIPPGQANKIEQLKVRQNSDQENEEENEQENEEENEERNEGEKYKGLPYGLSKRKNLPPGLAKKLELPPGLAKKIQEVVDGDIEFNEEKAEELIKELNELIEEVTNFTEDEDNLLIYSQANINSLKELVLDAKKVISDVDMEDLEATINKLSNTIESLEEKYEDIVSLRFATIDEIKEYNEYYTRLVNYIDELKNDFEENFGDNPGQYPLERFVDFYEVVYAESLIEEDAEITFGELLEKRELLKEAFETFEESKFNLEDSREEKIQLLQELINEAGSFVAIPENITEYNKGQIEELKKVTTQAQYLMFKMSNEAIVVKIEELDSMIILLQESLGKAKLVRAATKEEINNYNSMLTSLKKGLDEIESQVGTLYTIKEYIAYYNFIYELEFIEQDADVSIVELNGIKNEIKLTVDEFIVIKQPK